MALNGSVTALSISLIRISGDLWTSHVQMSMIYSKTSHDKYQAVSLSYHPHHSSFLAKKAENWRKLFVGLFHHWKKPNRFEIRKLYSNRARSELRG